MPRRRRPASAREVEAAVRWFLSLPAAARVALVAVAVVIGIAFGPVLVPPLVGVVLNRMRPAW